MPLMALQFSLDRNSKFVLHLCLEVTNNPLQKCFFFLSRVRLQGREAEIERAFEYCIDIFIPVAVLGINKLVLTTKPELLHFSIF